MAEVFSSPAAHTGRPLTSQTPWWRWITSTRGTLPSGRLRFGWNPTIQPSTCGRCVFGANSIVFWPGLILTGPNS